MGIRLSVPLIAGPIFKTLSKPIAFKAAKVPIVPAMVIKSLRLCPEASK